MGFDLVAGLFAGRHIKDQVATLLTKNEAGDDIAAMRFKCIEGGDPSNSFWEATEQLPTIEKAAIKILPADYTSKQVRFQWLCPQCGDLTHGSAEKDSVFEIRHDPRCIYCRVFAKEFRFDGSKFVKCEVAA